MVESTAVIKTVFGHTDATVPLLLNVFFRVKLAHSKHFTFNTPSLSRYNPVFTIPEVLVTLNVNGSDGYMFYFRSAGKLLPSFLYDIKT